MPITTIDTAGNILNRVAAEVGIQPVTDPVASQDPSFIQMKVLLDVAGEELLQAYPWELLVKEENFQTTAMDSGDYPLPADFFSMIDQTGWERNENVPLFGPLSPQDWQYLLGRDLVKSTIYASFRINEGLFRLFPQPPIPNLDISYEYVSKNWVQDGADANVLKDQIDVFADKPLYDRTLISRYVKMKFLEAKGFDSAKAQDDFFRTFSFLTSKDRGAEVLNVGGSGRRYPYLDTWRNLPDSGYGSVFP